MSNSISTTFSKLSAVSGALGLLSPVLSGLIWGALFVAAGGDDGFLAVFAIVIGIGFMGLMSFTCTFSVIAAFLRREVSKMKLFGAFMCAILWFCLFGLFAFLFLAADVPYQK